MDILATPSPANNYILSIGLVHPSLSGTVTVYDVNGGAVWSGEVSASAPANVHLMGSGLYFVRGMGRDVPVSVVR